MKKYLIKLLGGYCKDEVLTEAVKELYNTIGQEDILQEEPDGKFRFLDKTMTDADKQRIVVEAREFTKTLLWKVLQIDVKYQANKMMFLEAENEIQITAGKLWLYTLDCFKTRLNSLSKQSGILRK